MRLLQLLLWTVSCAASAAGEEVQVDLVRVIDGDTIVVNIAEWPPIIGKEIRVRLAGIDTPEIRRVKCPEEKELGLLAKKYLEELLRDVKILMLTNIGRGKFFRLVADVRADGQSVNQLLLDRGHAKVYGGDKGWCSLVNNP